MDHEQKLAIAFFLIAATLMGVGLGIYGQQGLMRDEFAETSCAQYNPTTGKFEYVLGE